MIYRGQSLQNNIHEDPILSSVIFVFIFRFSNPLSIVCEQHIGAIAYAIQMTMTFAWRLGYTWMKAQGSNNANPTALGD